MNCPRCDGEIPDGARFCIACGNALFASCPECGTELRRQVQEVVDHIANCCGTPELCRTFLGSAKVQDLLKDM